MTDKPDLTLAILAPSGRAGRAAEVSFAHDTAQFLARKGVKLVTDGAPGETGDAMIRGALKAGGKVTVVVDAEQAAPDLPKGVEIVATEGEQTVEQTIGMEAQGMWVFPPRVPDLERYYTAWQALNETVLVCLSRGDEFRLLDGIVTDVLSVSRPMDAARVVFSNTAQDGWERMREVLHAKA
ncbi:RNA-binding protein [Cucumibacter marinus]|uniref:hypothetical protein n=1 Tax=Cucumibacter marinus TaxID=1121252 RepID=UPI000418FEFF|nr:hypothetical protein [Cucumibacter marinus]